jgi:hypothetical protein
MSVYFTENPCRKDVKTGRCRLDVRPTLAMACHRTPSRLDTGHPSSTSLAIYTRGFRMEKSLSTFRIFALRPRLVLDYHAIRDSCLFGSLFGCLCKTVSGSCHMFGWLGLIIRFLIVFRRKTISWDILFLILTIIYNKPERGLSTRS